MTFCSLYVGDLDDPAFHWVGGNWNDNIPSAVTPNFPPPSQGVGAQFFEWVDSSGVEWKKTDFSGYVARVTKPQILEFIDFCYGSDPGYRRCARSSAQNRLPKVANDPNEIRDFVVSLSDAKEYALVAEEY